MSVQLLVKIGTALGVGGLVYWGVSSLFGGTAAAAPTTTKDSAKKPGAPAPKPAPPPPKDYTGISGETNAGSDVTGTVLSKAALDAKILAAERATARPGYTVSPTETWRDPGDNSLYAIWYRDSDHARGVFYDGLFRRMG